jgi:hypothetical protein
MPIRPENLNRYPPDWPQISYAIRARAGFRCEACGVPNGDLGGRDAGGNWYRAAPLGCDGNMPLPGQHGWCHRDGRGLYLRIVRIVLTVAHLDHTPENCDPDNLRAWCQRCHNLSALKLRRAGILARFRASAAVGDLFDGLVA